ncbi:hypothetical protein M8C21_008919 [Ambrosia artemisiifolia]|uniref:HHO5-like N-terminal domain-containing protein n=1 Tax=Ambrosia artemisiifolia TaxID=4212 RepID=A0AAD5CXB6_AMBAR|nr:hypothetical protein M8C21_008919 [Ambrosia artemisiifolia]
MKRCQEYMKALESERRKIQVFERELPLCLELVTQAIEGCRQQMCGTTTDYLSNGPVLEEFIPVKRNISADEDDHDGQEQSQLFDKPNIVSSKLDKSSSFKKEDWLRSAQLSIQAPDPLDLSPKKVPVVEVKRNGCGAFHPFKKEKCSGAAPATGTAKLSVDPTGDASSTAETGSGGGGGGDCGSKIEDKGQLNRKARRCWSPELHRRFLQALQQLGGAHGRRPSSTIHNNSQTPQFVVVGGLWVPPPEYATMATNSTPTSGDTNNSNGVYAPIASHPQPMVETSMSPNKSGSCEKDGGHSHDNSSSTSSSTHTTTASTEF